MFFNAHPDFAQRFPGGIIQFAQMADKLPADVLENMMIAEVVGNEVQDRNMPRAMPILFTHFSDEENEVNDTEAPLKADVPAQALNVPAGVEGNSDPRPLRP